jgi:hypothetical protein
MANLKQTNLLDAMVARLEEANAQAYEQFARVDEAAEDTRHPSDQQKPPPVLDRPSSHGKRALLVLIGLLLTASLCVATFAWQSSSGDAAKLSLPLPAPLARTTPQDVAPAAAPMPPELAQWMQIALRDFVDLDERIEKLKVTQEQLVRDTSAAAEQLEAALAQMARDNAAVAEQLKAALAQMARDNVAVTEQLKASQEQLTTLVTLRAAASARKPFRLRKPVPRSVQARAQP